MSKRIRYCNNDGCEAEAVRAVLREDRDTYPLCLCYTCATAYEWGQASPGRAVVEIEDVEPEEWLRGDGWMFEGEQEPLEFDGEDEDE